MTEPNSKYSPTTQDIRRAIEDHGREISFTKLAVRLTPIANAHHCRYVDWHMMKRVVEGMCLTGEVERVRERQGYYRYRLKDMFE